MIGEGGDDSARAGASDVERLSPGAPASDIEAAPAPATASQIEHEPQASSGDGEADVEREAADRPPAREARDP
jgi:hypothetical protein